MTNSADSTSASPAHVNGALYPKPPRGKPIRITRQRRERMEEIVDGLLRLLDEVDDDPDEEPSLGINLDNPSRAAVDCEGEDDNGIADAEGLGEQTAQTQGEPSLGWTATIRREGPNFFGPTSIGWNVIGDDAEEEHDGRENEDEAVGRMNGPRHPDDDNGIGDDGGAQEQFSGAFTTRFDGSGHRIAQAMLRERR